MNRESLVKRVRALEPEDRLLTAEDLQHIVAFLGSKAGLKLLHRLDTGAAVLDKLTTVDLTTREGLDQALAQQGLIRGYRMTFENLCGLTEEKIDA
jgi:hypothetical protein